MQRDKPPVGVRSADDILGHLKRVCEEVTRKGSCGLLLSSGIDSAILAAMLPSSTPTFTIRFAAEGAVDESTAARSYAEHLDLKNTAVDVGWSEYEATIDRLMRHKKSPLHPVEAALYCAGLAARKAGVDTLLTGNGADSTFGGLDRLLSRDWDFESFVERYTFLDPQLALRRPRSMTGVFEPYRAESGIDVVGFLKEVHGAGIVQMFENALECAGCRVVSPYEDLALDVPLDLDRIRGGEPKYLLQEVFRRLFPDHRVPEKIAFARPVNVWLQDWSGPTAEVFAEDLEIGRLTGEQRWIAYCLDRFLALL
jgi:asparagine synthetase B (glutamine-hydrolysing)